MIGLKIDSRTRFVLCGEERCRGALLAAIIHPNTRAFKSHTFTQSAFSKKKCVRRFFHVVLPNWVSSHLSHISDFLATFVYWVSEKHR